MNMHNPSLLAYFSEFNSWLNDNQGMLSLLLFLITAIYGWSSGIFASLRRRPKFSVELIPGPTFACTFSTGEMYGKHESHQTSIALYLKISNIGSAASSIDNISIGYHWSLRPLSITWMKYKIGWFWLHEQAVSLSDFQVRIGESTKFYPFLIQKNSTSPSQVDTFLDVGKSANGVVYFEQKDSWGGCFPFQKNSRTLIKIKIRDVFGRYHVSKHQILAVSLEEARQYNPTFGSTFKELRKKTLATPIDGSEAEQIG